MYSYIAFKYESNYDDDGNEKDRKNLEKIKRYVVLKGRIIDPENDIVEKNLFESCSSFNAFFVIKNANGCITIVRARDVDGFVFKPIED